MQAGLKISGFESFIILPAPPQVSGDIPETPGCCQRQLYRLIIHERTMMKNTKLVNSLIVAAVASGIALSAVAAGQAQVDAAKPVQMAAESTVATTPADDEITAAAKAALTADAQSAALPVSISTKQGIVMLSGNVPSAEAGDRVLQIVAAVSGVKEVRNEMRVKTGG
jgi:hyperosmotically inducible protein